MRGPCRLPHTLAHTQWSLIQALDLFKKKASAIPFQDGTFALVTARDAKPKKCLKPFCWTLNMIFKLKPCRRWISISGSWRRPTQRWFAKHSEYSTRTATVWSPPMSSNTSWSVLQLIVPFLSLDTSLQFSYEHFHSSINRQMSSYGTSYFHWRTFAQAYHSCEN